MTTPVIETNGLSKDFGSILAVDNLSLSVPKGSVFGLLGPNGAGKTTIIGILLGLITPTSGKFSLFGEEMNGSIESALQRIGATMETPSFYPYLSGLDNLRYFQQVAGHNDAAELDSLLELHESKTGEGERRIRPYSGSNNSGHFAITSAFRVEPIIAR